MADELKRVGLVFKADGAVDFKKSIQQVNDAVQENRNSFKLAKAAWDGATTSADKLKDRQEYLAKQTSAYSQKVSVLEEELKALEGAEEKNTQAIRKKRSQLNDAKATLINYEKGLKEVTEQITSGSVAMEEKIKKLDRSLETLSESAKENQSAFEFVKSEWEEGTKTAKKLKDEQEFLASQTKNYQQQVEALEKQLGFLEKAENKDEKAISAKKTQLNQTRTALSNYKKSLDDVEDKLKSGAAKVKDYTDKLDKFAEKAKSVGDKLGSVSTGAAGLAAGAAALVPATQEYRKIMASLESSSELAGYTAEQTEETYKQLFGVLGDDQTAATTTANLQALGLSQSQLTELVNGTIGAWAKYGDSIPIDGLAESINETIRAGQVTGTFADVLNWGSMEGERFGVKMKENTEANKAWNEAVASATTAEDFFNLALQEAGSNTERFNLVQQLLAEQGLTQAGTKWQETNKNIVEGNQATADFQQATAQLADTIAPIITRVTEVMAGLIEKFNALPPETQRNIAEFILLVAVASPLIKIVGGICSGVSTMAGIMKSGTTAAKLLSAALKFAGVGGAIGLVVTAIVILYEKCEWFRNLIDGMWRGIKKGLNWIADKIKAIGSLFGKHISEANLAANGITVQPVKARSVRWFAKGGILNRPTIFGRNGNEDMAGGEAGAEAILPIGLLKQYIREENGKSNAELMEMVERFVEMVQIKPHVSVYLGNKEFKDYIVKTAKKGISSTQTGELLAKGY